MKILLLCAVVCSMTSSVFSQTLPVADPPLRSDSTEDVIADLEAFIPDRMKEDQVTGLSIALIREHKVVWQKGFGMVNSITRERVTPETVFSAASLGKAVSAYLALQMVDEGGLSVDKPLHAYLHQPWLPQTQDHNAITLRHVLTHTSGLSNFLRDEQKNLQFKPGEQFSYSGVGFMYMQAVLEQFTSTSFDILAREQVFEPLAMPSSYFGRPHQTPVSITHGHIGFGRAIAPFSIIFTPSFLVLLLVTSLMMRLMKGTWRTGRILLLVLFLTASIGTFLFLDARAGGAILAAYFSLCALALIMIWVVVLWIGVRVFKHLFSKQKKLALAVHTGWGILSMVVLVFLLQHMPVPLPNWFTTGGNAASSLRSTAGDLAHFLIELSESRHLNATLMTQMQQPEISVNEHVSWGLGMGIQHSSHGESLWHWGSNPGSKSVMVVYPDQGIGVVVLSNSSNASDLVFELAGRALGGKAYWDT